MAGVTKSLRASPAQAGAPFSPPADCPGY
jgi:hypothetical protein